MSRLFLRGLILSAALWGGVGVLFGAEPASSPVPRSGWRPMADWYNPDLRVTKLAPRTVEQSELRLQMGDDPQWAAPDWNDRGWQVIERVQVPAMAGIFWLRVRVRTTGTTETVPSLVLVTGGLSAWECYWDGVPVGTQGIPGTTPEKEIEGVALGTFELPPALTAPGEHVVAWRVSTYHSANLGPRSVRLLFWTVPPEAYREMDSKLSLLPAMGVGAMVTLGIGIFVMWVLADRWLVLGLLSALCFSSALLIVTAAAPSMLSYPASWSSFQINARIVMVVIVASLLLAVAMRHLWPLGRRRWLAVPLLVEAAIAIYGQPLGVNALTPILWRTAFVAALAGIGWAVWQKRAGAWWLLAGVAGTAASFERDPKHFEHSDFLFGFLPVTIGFIAAIAMQLRGERLQARDTKLTAARLEIELLRKSLQPHFLMNTLTALSQVVEEKPAAAVRLIDDLATEFRSLSRLSGEKQVSLAEELALCRAHLGVMSARTDLAWRLEAEGVEADASVPPALFLTLIENGFSHQRANRESTAFKLRAERVSGNIRYRFLSPGLVTVESARVSGGTGLRYVRARLEESFPGAWTLSHGAVPGGWETVIELRHPTFSGASA